MSQEIYLAMQARGFRGEARTIDDFGMHGRDWIALCLFLTLAMWAIRFGR